MKLPRLTSGEIAHLAQNLRNFLANMDSGGDPSSFGKQRNTGQVQDTELSQTAIQKKDSTLSVWGYIVLIVVLVTVSKPAMCQKTVVEA